jgi:hypothetical protein
MEKEFNDEGEKGIDDLIENIKKKRNVKLFNQEEINFINDYNNHNYNLDEEEEKIQKFIFNPKKVNLKESEKNIVENNVILIRPYILSSTKQIEYENQINLNSDNYLYMLIKRLNRKKHGQLEMKDIKDKLKKYDNFIHNLHIKKVKEKFNLSKKNDLSKTNHTILEEIDKSTIKRPSFSNNSDNSSEVIHYRRPTFYDKILMCCCRSPLKSYALKKKIWAGEDGIFKKYFQDNREFN